MLFLNYKSLPDLLAEACRLGVAVWVESETLRVRGPTEAKATGSAIIEQKNTVRAFLAQWNQPFALRLMDEADAAIEPLKAGRDGVIATEAAECVRLSVARDLIGVMACCGKIHARANQIGKERGHASGAESGAVVSRKPAAQVG